MTFCMLLKIINQTKVQFKFAKKICIVLFLGAHFKINHKY